MMKKMAWVLCVVLAFGMFSACGGGGSQSASTAQPGSSSPAPSKSASQPAGQGSSADYKAVIEAAREPELNTIGLYDIVSGPDDGQHGMLFYEGSLFVEEDMARYAISSPGIITVAYTVAVILPKAGREAAVLDSVNAFVQQQQNAMENYLPNQYEITKAAIVKTMPTGEVVLVMCEGAVDVMAAIEAGLAA